MSVELATYFRLRAAGVEVSRAAEESGLLLKEAQLWEEAVARGEASFSQGDDDMARDTEATISVNGGPDVPLSVVKEALDVVKGSNGASVAADQLRLFIERVERLEEEKKGTSDDIKDVYSEAKANGYDPKIMRLMVRLRKMESHTRQEQAAIASTYADALGMQGVLPL